MGTGSCSLVVRLRGAQPLDGYSVDEAVEGQVEESAKLDELVGAHLALPAQDMPEPFVCTQSGVQMQSTPWG